MVLGSKGLAHNLADHGPPQVSALQRQSQQIILLECADRHTIFKNAELCEVLSAHPLERNPECIRARQGDEFAGLSRRSFRLRHFQGRQPSRRFKVTVVAHPFIAAPQRQRDGSDYSAFDRKDFCALKLGPLHAARFIRKRAGGHG